MMQWPLPLTSLIRYLPSSLLTTSPFECPFHKKPDYSTFKVFGCACYPFLQPYNKHKFQFHSFECIFLGYNPHHKGYSYLDSSGRVYISKDVIFHETKFSCQEHSQPISHTSLSPTNYPLTVLQKPPTLPCTPLPLPS